MMFLDWILSETAGSGLKSTDPVKTGLRLGIETQLDLTVERPHVIKEQK